MQKQACPHQEEGGGDILIEAAAIDRISWKERPTRGDRSFICQKNAPQAERKRKEAGRGAYYYKGGRMGALYIISMALNLSKNMENSGWLFIPSDTPLAE